MIICRKDAKDAKKKQIPLLTEHGTHRMGAELPEPQMNVEKQFYPQITQIDAD